MPLITLFIALDDMRRVCAEADVFKIKTQFFIVVVVVVLWRSMMNKNAARDSCM